MLEVFFCSHWKLKFRTALLFLYKYDTPLFKIDCYLKLKEQIQFSMVENALNIPYSEEYNK